MLLGTRERRPSAARFDSREDYLFFLTGRSSGHRICQASASESKRPWFTLVLGNGCSQTDDHARALSKVAERLGDLKSELAPETIDGLPVADVVREFATDLIRDRLQVRRASGVSTPASRSGDEPDASLEDWQHSSLVFDLVLASALLAKLYHAIKAGGTNAPRRQQHDDRATLGKRAWRYHILREEYLEPSVRLLKSLKLRSKDIASQVLGAHAIEFQKTLDSLLDAILAGLEDSQISLSQMNVQAMAEFSWFCVAGWPKHKVYPGWSDLVLELSHLDNPSIGTVGVPSFQLMTEVGVLIKGRYEQITKESFNDRRPRPTYTRAAKLLLAEFSYWFAFRKKNAQAEDVPVPVAFVTSFDVELELALLREGKPFVMAVPVYLVDRENKLVHPCWMTYDVDPQAVPESDWLSLLTNSQSRPGNWKLLSFPDRDPGCFGLQGPVVIRLVGAPLVAPPLTPKDHPSLWQVLEPLREDATAFAQWEHDSATEAEVRQRIEDGIQLHSAVLVNEHDSVLHSAIDLCESSSLGALGLPTEFVRNSQHWNRFWLLLGVQIQDNAVRQRIANLVSVLPTKEYEFRPRSLGRGGGAPAGEYAHLMGADRCCKGLAVNTLSTQVGQDLLFWSGIDVVSKPDDVGSVKASSFDEDLEHYASHLENALKDKTSAIFTGGGVCDK
ncbi:MAG: hypothetical protein AB1806_09505 [Acidobacteriota bacterium]